MEQAMMSKPVATDGKNEEQISHPAEAGPRHSALREEDAAHRARQNWDAEVTGRVKGKKCRLR